MSLLLQALQKAAKNRDDTTGNPAVPSDDDRSLTLEPLAEPQLNDQEPSAEESQTEPSPSPQDAADVMRANDIPSYSALDWAREHYMLTFLAGAALFAIVYGLYVYVQVSNPRWLRSTPPPMSAPVQTTAALAPASADETPRISGLPEAAPAGADKPDGNTPATAQSTGKGMTEPKAATALAAEPSAPATPRAAPATRLATATSNARARLPRKPTARVDSEGVEIIEIPATASVAVLPRGKTTPEQAAIEVQSQDGTLSRIDPVLMMAYQALQRGQYEKAGALYDQVLSRDANSTDALLGLAAIAWKQGQTNTASQYYGRVLEMDPRNSHAQAGLIAILGNADPIAAETRLKQLIDREPSGFLYFTLGNLYAERNLWSQAQRAYFQAHQLQPDNSDYAFNLAVGLEHLGQTRPALDYYRKALDLSFKNGRANFDQELAIERVGELSARVD